MKKEIEIDSTFELAYRFVTETNENIFLTGKAGTGKTTFLKYLKDHCTKNVVIAAPTGVAAINAGGVTLHSLFRLPLHPFLPTDYERSNLLQQLRYRKNKLQLLRKMDLLVIDEISMVRADVLDAVDTILRSVRKKTDRAFGGVQILLIGDLYQLPPVAKMQEWMLLQEFYDSEFFFDSQVIKEEKPVVIELKKIFRQQDDYFLSILNKVRNNRMDTEDYELLHERYQPHFTPGYEDHFITLTSHNIQADRKNQSELNHLPGRKFIYEAKIEGIFPENAYPAEVQLELKEGAQVMFLKNDIEKRYYNGKIGIVKYLDEEKIVVDCDNEEIEVPVETWDNSQYNVDNKEGKLQQQVMGTFRQYPLRLAWAVTIHKSQGLTFDQVMIEAASAFSSGQVYVALSRCTSLEGIVLLSQIPPSAILCNDAVIAYSKNTTSESLLSTRFDGARQIYTQQLLEDIFSFDELHKNISLLEASVIQFGIKLNDDAHTWIVDFKRIFTGARVMGLKFSSQIADHLREEPKIEANERLQKRISDAASHFLPIFQKLEKKIISHPLTTEHREVSDNIDPYINEVYSWLHQQIHAFRYCKNPFSVTGFLEDKLNYITPRRKLYTYASHRTHTTTNVVNAPLFDSLKSWRDDICKSENIPIYMVANKKSLIEIATFLPLSKKDLQKIRGFGPAKAMKYGDEIIDLVQEYCDKMNLITNIEQLAAASKCKSTSSGNPSPGEPKLSSKDISFNMYKEGKSIEEIAKERGFSPTTIEGHLATFVKEKAIDINDFVSPEIQKKIAEAAGIHGWESLKVLKEYLPEEITYGQIRITKTSLQ